MLTLIVLATIIKFGVYEQLGIEIFVYSEADGIFPFDVCVAEVAYPIDSAIP
jgi:hypothetical protein